MTEKLINEMIGYYQGDPKRIQHFLKVYSFSRTIAVLEGVGGRDLFILETAAIVHDIGIKLSEQKHGNCNGKLQEKYGPDEAGKMLGRLGYEDDIIQRVKYLVGHHHTYDNIDGIDYQILVEADFLVNLYEDNVDSKGILNAYTKIFKTETGLNICRQMFKPDGLI